METKNKQANKAVNEELKKAKATNAAAKEALRKMGKMTEEQICAIVGEELVTEGNSDDDETISTSD